MQHSKTLVVICLAMAFSSFSHAAHLALVGDADFSSYNANVSGSTVTTTRKMGYGGGALLEFRFGKSAGLEIGALYLQRKSGTDLGSLTFSVVEVPLILRYWISQKFSIGVGPYAAYGLGSVAMTDPSGASAGTESYSTASVKNLDYGVAGVVGFNFPIGGSTALVLEGRYTQGLANVFDGTGFSITFSEVQALVGLRFGSTKD